MQRLQYLNYSFSQKFISYTILYPRATNVCTDCEEKKVVDMKYLVGNISFIQIYICF